MAKSSRNNIKQWFLTNLYPTQQQFWNWLDSFYHLDDQIPQSAIENLDQSLNEKADKEAFEAHLTDENAHNTLFEAKQNTLESGVNIKTINGESILGEGNLVIEGVGGSGGFKEFTTDEAINEFASTYETIFNASVEPENFAEGTVLEWGFFAEVSPTAPFGVTFKPSIFGVNSYLGFSDSGFGFASFELIGNAFKLADGSWKVNQHLKMYSDAEGNAFASEEVGRRYDIPEALGVQNFQLQMLCNEIGALKFTGGYIREAVGGSSSGVDGNDGVDGLSAYQIAVNNGFVGTEVEWLASLQGADGNDGANGANGANGADGNDGVDGTDGLSAYQIAVNNGFVGTEVEWLASLQGADGNDGANGANGADGNDGVDGTDGLSAYQIAVNNGFVGTEVEWLASLQGADGNDGADGTNGTNGIDGEDGASAYQIAVANGFVGTEVEWLESLQGDQGEQGIQGIQGVAGNDGSDGEAGADGADGADGASAYQIAVANGFVGTEVEWLESLQGEQGIQGIQGIQGVQGVAGNDGADGTNGTNGIDGADGASAYQIAVNNGFVGTEVEWLASLQGEQGEPGTGGSISNAPYSNTWLNNTTEGASKDALYNKIETLKFYGFAGSAEDGIPVNGVIYHDRVHGDFRLGELKFSLKTADTTATLTFDILKNGVSIMDTPATIDPGETTSKTAAVPYVINDVFTPYVDFADDDEISVVLSGTPTDAVGLKGKLIQVPMPSGGL